MADPEAATTMTTVTGEIVTTGTLGKMARTETMEEEVGVEAATATATS